MDYDGRVFAPVDFAGDRRPPTGRYSQVGDLVWAEFSGAYMRAGRLVGRCLPDGSIESAYCQITTDGKIVAGQCVSTPNMLSDGRLQLVERWRRADGTRGISLIEEVS